MPDTPVSDTDPWAEAAPTPAARHDRPWLIAQWRLEEILRARLAGYGVQVELGREVVGLAEGPEGQHMAVAFGEGPAVRARYVVGCDGAHSSVRKLLRIPFDGTTAEDRRNGCPSPPGRSTSPPTGCGPPWRRSASRAEAWPPR
ncbi:FAD-dependent monooxygenase [Streptomyces sp. SAI-25]|uniref:FAD-dependent monooxygenase n=1 Tax=Streptomyces sp. SAI-25 TaxID=1472664 RepID=UPI004039659B